MPSDIEFQFQLANNSEFRDQLAYALTPVVGTILSNNGDGTYTVDASEGDGGELTARPLDQRTYDVGDFVWCIIAFSTNDSAIILGSYNPRPATLTADAILTDGINFGQDTLSTYDQNTWTPVITTSGTAPTITYTTQTGIYTQIGNVVLYAATIVIATISGGTGDARFSLPTNQSFAPPAVANLSGVDLQATTNYVNFAPLSGSAFGRLREVQDNAAVITTLIGALAAGDTISYAGFYFV